MKRRLLGLYLVLLCGTGIGVASEIQGSHEFLFSNARCSSSLSFLQTPPCVMSSEACPSSQNAPLNLTTPVDPSPVVVIDKKDRPEPATIALIGLGAMAVCSCRRRGSR